MTALLHRWRIAIETLAAIIVICLAKVVIEQFQLEFVSQNPLFTSIIAGGIFLFGLMLAGVLSDYKESEKLPAELVSSCEAIFEDFGGIKESYPDADLAGAGAALKSIVDAFRADLRDSESRSALAAISNLSTYFVDLEKMGAPPNYIVRLRTEQSTMRKSLLRTYYIQRIDFLPSAYHLVLSIVVFIIVLLLFTKIEPLYEAVALNAFVAYIFIYILKLLRNLDTPFRATEHTTDDVSLFLLREFTERVDRALAGETA